MESQSQIYTSFVWEYCLALDEFFFGSHSLVAEIVGVCAQRCCVYGSCSFQASNIALNRNIQLSCRHWTTECIRPHFNRSNIHQTNVLIGGKLPYFEWSINIDTRHKRRCRWRIAHTDMYLSLRFPRDVRLNRNWNQNVKSIRMCKHSKRHTSHTQLSPHTF